jgi:hypothetical protein
VNAAGSCSLLLPDLKARIAARWKAVTAKL